MVGSVFVWRALAVAAVPSWPYDGCIASCCLHFIMRKRCCKAAEASWLVFLPGQQCLQSDLGNLYKSHIMPSSRIHHTQARHLDRNMECTTAVSGALFSLFCKNTIWYYVSLCIYELWKLFKLLKIFEDYGQWIGYWTRYDYVWLRYALVSPSSTSSIIRYRFFGDIFGRASIPSTPAVMFMVWSPVEGNMQTNAHWISKEIQNEWTPNSWHQGEQNCWRRSLHCLSFDS